jgi:hypothetical protein
MLGIIDKLGFVRAGGMALVRGGGMGSELANSGPNRDGWQVAQRSAWLTNHDGRPINVAKDPSRLWAAKSKSIDCGGSDGQEGHSLLLRHQPSSRGAGLVLAGRS